MNFRIIIRIMTQTFEIMIRVYPFIIVWQMQTDNKNVDKALKAYKG